MQTRIVVVIATFALTLAGARAAEAGCGCHKPPPPPSQLRPAFAPPGSMVTIFDDGLVEGQAYTVSFERKSVSATAVRKRDLADSVMKVQLPVRVPQVKMGPTRVKVKSSGTLAVIAESDFTVLQRPIVLEEMDGEMRFTCYRAAIGSDGTMYIPIHLGAIADRMLFSGLAESYPLRFGPDDIIIYNDQGYTMEMLTAADTNLISVRDLGPADSFEAAYDRHEFQTYRDKHLNRPEFALDPADPEWHVDGTPHIDHDNLIVAIRGQLPLEEGIEREQTPPFDFSVVTTLVDHPGPPELMEVAWSDECTGTGGPGAPGNGGTNGSAG